MILNHLMNGSITSKEAMQRYGIYRLAARIKDLRNEGYVINTIMMKRKNPFDRMVSYASYELIQLKGEAYATAE